MSMATQGSIPSPIADAPLMIPPKSHSSVSAARSAPANWASRYPGTRFQGKLPRSANAQVTTGLRWAPETAPMK